MSSKKTFSFHQVSDNPRYVRHITGRVPCVDLGNASAPHPEEILNSRKERYGQLEQMTIDWLLPEQFRGSRPKSTEKGLWRCPCSIWDWRSYHSWASHISSQRHTGTPLTLLMVPSTPNCILTICIQFTAAYLAILSANEGNMPQTDDGKILIVPGASKTSSGHVVIDGVIVFRKKYSPSSDRSRKKGRLSRRKETNRRETVPKQMGELSLASGGRASQETQDQDYSDDWQGMDPVDRDDSPMMAETAYDLVASLMEQAWNSDDGSLGDLQGYEWYQADLEDDIVENSIGMQPWSREFDGTVAGLSVDVDGLVTEYCSRSIIACQAKVKRKPPGSNELDEAADDEVALPADPQVVVDEELGQWFIAHGVSSTLIVAQIEMSLV